MNRSSTHMVASFICRSSFACYTFCGVLVVWFYLTVAAHAEEAGKGCREAFADHVNTIQACNVVIASGSTTTPQLIRAYQIRAQALLSTGKSLDAIADYSWAIELLPVGQLQGYILYLRGDIRVRLVPSQRELGILDLERANSQAPANTRILEALAHAYMRKEQLKKAIESASQALLTDPRSLVARTIRARAHDQLGYTHLVLDDLNALLEQAPHRYDLFVWRGRIHQKRNNLYSALADYRNAVRMRSSDDLLEKIRMLERSVQ